MKPGSPEERLLEISRSLARLAPHLLPADEIAAADEIARASVALVVRPNRELLDILLIKRAMREGDPWSGHIALPGGRSGPADADARATAERETWEEVGIDLRASGTLLGRLDDVRPRAGGPGVLVSAFVFSVPPDTPAVWNHEVDLATWVSLEQLAAPGAARQYLHAVGGAEVRFPALGFDEHVIWGITFRILTQFLDVIGRAARGC